MAIACSPTLINNTIAYNHTTLSSGTYGGGIFAVGGASFTGVNNIIYFNTALSEPNVSGTVNLNYSCCSQTLSGTGNITGDPMFVGGPQYNFYLLGNSPCIDTGDPGSALDPDGSRADMGAVYYIHASPQLDVTMIPLNPPISISPHGGSFQFNASVVNHGPNQAPFVVWGRIKNPNGTYTATLLGPVTINPPVNVTVMRQRNQNVPGSWDGGLYTYLGYSNWTYTYPALDSSFFTFTKLVTGAGPYVWDAACYGEPFPGEVAGTHAVATTFTLNQVSPNPFNPTTVLSFELRVPSYVSLKVYDTAGRIVTTLVEGWREAGIHEATFDGSSLASGVYLYRLEAGGQTAVGKMMLLK